MPRPEKTKICGCKWEAVAFKPTAVPMTDLKRIPLSEAELESLRLCDLLGLTQAQAGDKMGVSRGTVQRLVTAARRKAADAIVNKHALILGEISKKESTR